MKAKTPPPAEPAEPRQVIGRLLGPGEPNGQPAAPPAAPIALFCHDVPDGYIGGHVGRAAVELGRRGNKVHLFAPHDFQLPGVRVHRVNAEGEALVPRARSFCQKAVNAFLDAVPGGAPAGVVCYEWAAAGVLPLLRSLRNQHGALSLHSLEPQRSGMESEDAKAIHAIEREALDVAKHVLAHDAAAAEVARQCSPACAPRITIAHQIFDPTPFDTGLDPGAVKAKYQIGPLDPVLLYVGDLEDRYGPELLVKAMPAILRHHKQARLVLVGEGSAHWPLRVYSRYLLLDHSIRILGSVEGRDAYGLVEACDILCVPSREPTPWWPIMAAWAAKKPVVATHEAARPLLEHEKDSVLIYPSENSVVWGVERVLYDENLRKAIGVAGRAKLEERFGWNALAEQIEQLLAPVPA